MTFPCVQCGLCCHEVGKVSALAEYDRGDGVCRHLKNNLCGIYENRPLICNVSKMYDLHFSTEIDEKTFFQMNLAVCLKLAEDYPEIKSKIKALCRQEV